MVSAGEADREENRKNGSDGKDTTQTACGKLTILMNNNYLTVTPYLF